MKNRVDFCWRGGPKLIQRNGGGSPRKCAWPATARLGLAGGDQRCSRKRGFPFRLPHLREAADDREPRSLCEECLSSFERVPIIIGGVCGRPLPGVARKDGAPLLCPACQEKTYTFDRARSFAVYAETVVRAILLLKFERIEPLGAWFSERLAEIVNADSGQLSADVVVPVPLHREREKNGGTTRRH
jgi:predicted amidophosphoribosyltransferase